MRLSHSSKNVYRECPYKWFNHYYRKLRTLQESSALQFGNSVDLGLNTLLETRDVSKALTIFEESWVKVRAEQNIKYSKSDLQEELIKDLVANNEKDKSWLSLNEKGKILINEYNDQVMPKIGEVIKVQLDQVIKNETGDELVIKTDFIAEWLPTKQRVLFDNKTSSVKYEENSVKESAQLATYFDGLKDEYKLDACGYIVLPKKINKRKKPAIDIKIIIDQVAEETIEATFKEYEEVLEGVKAARFEKNLDACQGIFGRCVYYQYCRNGSTEGLIEKSDEKNYKK